VCESINKQFLLFKKHVDDGYALQQQVSETLLEIQSLRTRIQVTSEEEEEGEEEEQEEQEEEEEEVFFLMWQEGQVSQLVTTVAEQQFLKKKLEENRSATEILDVLCKVIVPRLLFY